MVFYSLPLQPINTIKRVSCQSNESVPPPIESPILYNKDISLKYSHKSKISVHSTPTKPHHLSITIISKKYINIINKTVTRVEYFDNNSNSTFYKYYNFPNIQYPVNRFYYPMDTFKYMNKY